MLGRCRSLQRSSSGQMFGAGNIVVFLLEEFLFEPFAEEIGLELTSISSKRRAPW